MHMLWQGKVGFVQKFALPMHLRDALAPCSGRSPSNAQHSRANRPAIRGSVERCVARARYRASAPPPRHHATGPPRQLFEFLHSRKLVLFPCSHATTSTAPSITMRISTFALALLSALFLPLLLATLTVCVCARWDVFLPHTDT